MQTINPKLLEKIILAVPRIEANNTSVRIPKPFGGLINYKDTTIRFHDIRQTLIKHAVDNVILDKNYFSEVSALWNDINDITQQSKELLDLLERILL